MKLKHVSLALMILGALGILMGAMMFGDIGTAAMIGGAVGILSGYGFRLLNQNTSE